MLFKVLHFMLHCHDTSFRCFTICYFISRKFKFIIMVKKFEIFLVILTNKIFCIDECKRSLTIKILRSYFQIVQASSNF